MNEWYILYNGQQVGPMTRDQLLSYGLTPNTQVWCTGMPQWAPVYTIPELMSLINNPYPNPGPNPCPNPNPGPGPRPAPGPNPYINGDVNTTGKDKTVAGILAILIGTLGIQYFYCGKVAGGLITILLSVVTCGAWWIVTLIQGIMMLTMTQAQFEQKYVNTPNTFPLF